MNTPTPTPRTDAAWASSFEPCEYRAAHTARTMRECSQQLETELATLTAERDQLRAQNDQFSDNLSTVGAAYNAEKARAERAEAELAALAKDNARLDWLLQDDVTRFDVSYHDRAAIDKAMKEGAK